MRRTLIPIIIISLTVSSVAENVDILKPVYQRQELEFQRIMEQLYSEGLKYEIVSEEVKMPKKMFPYYYATHVKTASIPFDIKEKTIKYDQRFSRWHFAKYLEDKRYSFHAAVLILGRGTSTTIPESIIIHDADLWRNKDMGIVKNLFELLSAHHSFQRGRSEFVPLEGYFGAVLFESIPPYYNTNIFAGRVYEINIVSEPIPILPYGYSKGRMGDVEKSYGKYFNAYMNDNDVSELSQIPLIQPCVENWLHLSLFGETNKQTRSTLGLLEWSRIKSPMGNPFLSALMMGLFTVDGYSFDDETGVYAMNERGRLLMDYIVEFPIPENATRLQAVMGGGNKDEIETMMRKHGTGEKWKELLKNPVHPEFAKYPQND